MEMEWKDIDKEKPEYGKKCIVVDLSGQMAIKTYSKYNIKYNYESGRGKYVIPIPAEDISEGEGFITRGNTVDNSVAFWMELPKLPEKYRRAQRIKDEIEKLKKELDELRPKEPYVDNYEEYSEGED